MIRATRTVARWARDAFLAILRRMVVSAVETAWRIVAGLTLAVFGIGVAQDVAAGELPSPLDAPSEIASDLKSIVDGMAVLVQAAQKYMEGP